MTRQHIPQPVLDLAHARSTARADRDWTEADRLRAEIEAAGWKVVDRGTDFALSPAAAADLVDGDRVLYGSSASVPTLTGQPDIGLATVILIAEDDAEAVRRSLDTLKSASPAGTSVVIVANDPSAKSEAALSAPAVGPDVEVVWTAGRLGVVAAMNVGLRRATGPVVILLDAAAEPTGDLVTPLLRALDDPTVAIAGASGLRSTDLRTFTDSPAGEVVAVANGPLAFRRGEATARGPLEERFRSGRYLAIWWSLVLRDEGEGAAPRRAVALDGLPVIRHQSADPGDTRRDAYRLADGFGWRRELLAED